MCETLAIVGIVALLAYSAWWKHRTRMRIIREAQQAARPDLKGYFNEYYSQHEWGVSHKVLESRSDGGE